jgi:sugar phosphate isomerase/epimerase
MSNHTSRRAFLSGAAALAGMPALPSQAAGAENNAGDIKLGIASYSFREFSRAAAIRKTKALRVKYVSIKEFHLLYNSTPQELNRGANDFRKAGLEIVGGGAIYLMKDDDNDIRRYFEYAKTCGMPLMTIGPTHQTLLRIEKFVKEYNIKIAIHNHGPSDEHFPTPESALKALKGMDPRMGVCIDIGHTALAGVNPPDAIREAGDRLLDIHMRDLANLKDGRSEVPTGEGAMPIVDVFKALKEVKYQGTVNLEYESDPDDPMLGMAKSFAYMRGVLAGLRG